MAKEKPDLVYGTLDMLILKAIQHEPRHGLAIADRIQQMSSDVLRVEQGSLYPALQRMLRSEWVSAEWGVSPENRKIRIYKITAAGRRQLDAQVSAFERMLEGIRRVMKPVKI